ncbi:hypothetical protein [Streptomyces geranii]|uniref:hypothetical protein n=1 Tax=Streptomyces geranii TaxID=2058923 RepID=UPI000D03760C|nr:hypothetical protein [Streptomyces geranii]
MNAELPPVAPELVATAVESLTSRLRKKLDATVALYATTPVTADGTGVRIRCGEDAEVHLTPGPSGTLTDADQAVCTCLLAPRCLHRAAVLSACPVAEPGVGEEPGQATGEVVEVEVDGGLVAASEVASGGGSGGEGGSAAGGTTNPSSPFAPFSPSDPSSPFEPSGPTEPSISPEPSGPTPAQVTAATKLWAAAAAVLAAGVPAAGAVPQAELLRAAHTARLAGLHRAEAAALRVVRELRGARDRRDGHRLANLVVALRELLLTAHLLAAADPAPALIGTARRSYRPAGALRVLGVCREPVISATGYAGVVTHLVAEDGRWFSVADVKPGGPGRARAAAKASVALGSGTLDHAGLARGGLLISGATISPEGRLGAGKGVKATPVTGFSWTEGPLADALFGRPLTESVTDRLASTPGSTPDDGTGAEGGELIGCDLVVVGAVGEGLLARELPPGTRTPSADGPVGDGPGGDGPGADGPGADGPGGDGLSESGASESGALGSGAPGSGASGSGVSGSEVSVSGSGTSADDAPGEGPLIRLLPASSHPDLAHTVNFAQLAARPGVRIRVVGRLDPDRAATLRPLAVGPVPGGEGTLRLPAEWLGRVDLGYDRLQGTHFPAGGVSAAVPVVGESLPDPLADSPLWRMRRLVELAVLGGRRAVAEPARGDDRQGGSAVLRRSGCGVMAGLADALTAEADRRGRDVFGRLSEGDTDRYALVWLTAVVHLAGAERALVRATW